MRIISKKIEMIAYFKEKEEENPLPIRFRIEDKEGSRHIIHIESIMGVKRDRKAGNPLIIYDCQALVGNYQKPIQIFYEINTCKWYLFKI